MIQFPCSACGYELQAADGTSTAALIICDRCGERVTIPTNAVPMAAPANEFANLGSGGGDESLPEAPPDDDEPALKVDLPDPLPAEVKALGDPIRNCPTASKVPMGLIACGVIAIIVAVFGLFWWIAKANAPGVRTPYGLLIILLLLMPLGAFLIWLGTSVDWQARVVVFRKGFAYIKREQITVFPWDDIDAVWQAITNHYYNGAFTHTSHNYRIRAKGREVALDDVYPTIQWLGERIQNEVISRQLHRSIQTLNEGGTVRFGRLSVSPDGIGCDGTILPWSDVEKVEVQQGVISVRKQGKWFNWGKVSVPEVPNVFVFIALVDQIVGINTKNR